MTSPLIIATRKSKLALWQAEEVMRLLKEKNPALDVELLPMQTHGDKMLDAPLAKIGGKGLFIKALETAMLAGDAHIAVHSMKDVTVDLPEGLVLSSYIERGDPTDAFVCNKYSSIDALPNGALIGTSSLRRQALLKHYRPDLNIQVLRGNVQTRLAKLDAGDYDAILLASAGLARLGLHERIKQQISPDILLPAVGQGAIGIEQVATNASLYETLRAINDADTEVCVIAERAVNRALNGGCQVPIAAYATLDGETLNLTGIVAKTDGSLLLKASNQAVVGTSNTYDLKAADALGEAVAKALLDQGAGAILSEVYHG